MRPAGGRPSTAGARLGEGAPGKPALPGSRPGAAPAAGLAPLRALSSASRNRLLPAGRAGAGRGEGARRILPIEPPRRRSPELQAISAGAGRTARRKRGGQPGNTNALRHGFYSRRFRNQEIADLEAMAAQGLQDEIDMLRVAARRVMELADGVDTLEDAIAVLSTLSVAASRLAQLLKAQRALGAEGGEVAETLSQALKDVLKEWGRA